MQNNRKIKFGLDVDENDVLNFLKLIGIQSSEVSKSISFLQLFITNILQTIPFQNIMMILRPNRPPTPSEIKSDMLSGIGGPCGTMNPFIGAVLDLLGFDIHLVSGSMIKEDCHIALLLTLNNEKYYIDCGDGKPYFSPMPTNKQKIYKHPFKTFRTVPLKNGYFVIENLNKENQWIFNCRIDPTYKAFSFFNDTLLKHYTDNMYGPFLNSLRLVYYPKKHILGIRDNVLILQSKKDKCTYQTFDFEQNFLDITSKYFSQFPLPYKAVLKKLLKPKTDK